MDYDNGIKWEFLFLSEKYFRELIIMVWFYVRGGEDCGLMGLEEIK